MAAIDASAYLAFVPDCSPSINLANPCFCASFKAYLGNSPFPVTGAVPPVPSDGEEPLVSVFPLEAFKSTCLPLYIDAIIFDIALDNRSNTPNSETEGAPPEVAPASVPSLFPPLVEPNPNDDLILETICLFLDLSEI